MKKKKIIITAAAIVICIAAVAVIFGIRNKSLGSSVDAQNNISSTKTKHNTALEKSDSEKSNQSKGESMDKCKMRSDNKSKSSAAPAVQIQSQVQSKTASSNASDSQTQTFTGYITTEDDFAAGLHEDTADMVYMKLMAEAGLGITFQQNGKWIFYYVDGTIATKDTSGADGKWSFDGTGSQLNAWNIVGGQVKTGKGKSPVLVTVKGVVKGNTEVNPGPDTDGKSFQVITVESINKN